MVRLQREQKQNEEKQQALAAAMTPDQVRAHNAGIVTQLEQLSAIYNSTGDHWRYVDHTHGLFVLFDVCERI